MSETQNDAVASAFDALVSGLKDAAFAPGVTASEMARVVGYAAILGPMSENWKNALPVSGKAAGKRGRKPKDAGAAASESDELSPTQVETAVDTSGATSGGRGGRRAAA